MRVGDDQLVPALPPGHDLSTGTQRSPMAPRSTDSPMWSDTTARRRAPTLAADRFRPDGDERLGRGGHRRHLDARPGATRFTVGGGERHPERPLPGGTVTATPRGCPSTRDRPHLTCPLGHDPSRQPPSTSPSTGRRVGHSTNTPPAPRSSPAGAVQLYAHAVGNRPLRRQLPRRAPRPRPTTRPARPGAGHLPQHRSAPKPGNDGAPEPATWQAHHDRQHRRPPGRRLDRPVPCTSARAPRGALTASNDDMLATTTGAPPPPPNYNRPGRRGRHHHRAHRRFDCGRLRRHRRRRRAGTPGRSATAPPPPDPPPHTHVHRRRHLHRHLDRHRRRRRHRVPRPPRHRHRPAAEHTPRRPVFTSTARILTASLQRHLPPPTATAPSPGYAWPFGDGTSATGPTPDPHLHHRRQLHRHPHGDGRRRRHRERDPPRHRDRTPAAGRRAREATRSAAPWTGGLGRRRLPAARGR